MDCGPACIRMIAKFYGKIFSAEFIRSKTNISKVGVTLFGLADVAEKIGFRTMAADVSIKVLKDQVGLPVIVFWRNKHFVVLYKIKGNSYFVADPAYGLLKYSRAEFIDGWTNSIHVNSTYEPEGTILILEPGQTFFDVEENTTKKVDFEFIYRYVRPYKKYGFQLILGLLIGSCLQLIFPFLTQALVDYGINYQNLNFIYLILLAQLTLFISQTSVDLIRGWILLHVTSRINIHLISDFLIKLMRLPISFFDSKNTGDIIQRIYDHERIKEFVSNTTLNTLFSIANVLIFGIVLAYYSSTIFLIFFAGAAIYVGWTLLFLKKRKELDYKRFGESASNQSSIYQLISGMQEIKLNGSERRRRWEWETIQVRLFKVSLKSLSLTQSQNTGGIFVNELKNILITFIAAKSVIDGSLTLGMMLSIQYIIGQMNLPIMNFITFIQTGQDAKISLERLSEIHSKENEVNQHQGNYDFPTKGFIEIDQMSFSYNSDKSKTILRNLNCTIPEGKITAIVGPSGSGKTTLLKLLLKFYDLTSGNIFVGGINLANLNVDEWRKKCGCVMQEGFIFNDSILRNITESDSENLVNQERLLQAIEIANLKVFISDLPKGLNTKIGSAGINISGGQKQRILIARAVYKNPEYLFFDEATSALDANNEMEIMKKLNHFMEGRTVVVIAHRLSTVRNADQILVLDDGEIIEEGNHELLTNSRGMYYSLVKNQLELGA